MHVFSTQNLMEQVGLDDGALEVWLRLTAGQQLAATVWKAAEGCQMQWKHPMNPLSKKIRAILVYTKPLCFGQ